LERDWSKDSDTSAIVDWLSISQINGKMEKKTIAIQVVLHELLKRKQRNVVSE